MMRSLFSGVAGLRNHQTGMDVIGANIANVNTVGYKGSRTNFSDVISQTMQGAAAASDNRGGTNPIQIGLGVGVSSVDTIMTSGSYSPTGKQTDLAIQNQGFFIVSDGLNKYYTRAGNFDFDAQGTYELPGTGLKVMGWQGVNGVVDPNGPVTNIQVPAGVSSPAVATTKMTFINNLSGTDAPGATTQTSLDVYDSLGKVQTLGQKFVKVDDVNNVWLSKASLSDSTIPVSNALTEISFDTAGKIKTVKQVTPSTVPSTTLTLKSGLQLDTAATAHNTNTFSLVDSTGKSRDYYLQFTSATAFSVYAVGNATAVGTGTAAWNAATSSYTITPGAINDPALPVQAYTIAPSTVAGIAPAAGTFTGEVVPSATTTLTIPAFQMDNTSGSVHDAYYTVFDKDLTPHVLKMEFTQTANETWSYKMTEAGSSSSAALLSGTVTLTGSPGVLPYVYTPTFATQFTVGTGAAATKITLADPLPAAQILPAGNLFNAASAPTYGTSTTVNPVTFTVPGAAQSTVTMDVSALTQYGGASTVQASVQNGAAAGALDSVTLDTSGMIVGKFSNGKTVNLARVALATFTNAGGLIRTGDTLFSVSNNSGNPSIGASGTGGRGTITPGTLEMSNIDLADQFSKMIITQRGFQSNSKIITVSDEMLEILANLKR